MTFFNHLIILIYKNLLLKIRKPLSTLLELSFPAQLIIIIWLFTTLGFNIPQPNAHFQTLNPVSLCPHTPTGQQNICLNSKKIAISIIKDTASKQLQDAVPFLSHYLQQHSQLKVDVLESPEQYWNHYKDYLTHFVVQGLKVDTDGWVDAIVMQNHTDIMANQTLDYVNSGFMVLENWLHEALMSYIFTQGNNSSSRSSSGSNLEAKIHFQTREFPIKGNNSFLSLMIGIMYPMYFSLSVINLFLPHVIHLVNEKKEKIKSGLQMMGCSMVAYNMSWYIVAFLEVCIVLVVTTTLIYALKIFKYTNPTLFMTVFFLYSLSFIPLANTCSLFFTEPKYASMFANILFMAIIFAWVIVRFVFFNLMNTSLWIKLSFNLFSPFAFCEFMFQLSVMESSKQHFGWSNLGGLQSYSAAHNILFLFIDSVLYTIISLYMEKVVPSETGTSNSPLFCLSPSFWIGLFSRSRSSTGGTTGRIQSDYGMLIDEDAENEDVADTSNDIELRDTNEQPRHSDVENPQHGVVISNLTKNYSESKLLFFKTEKTVVDHLSLKINQGEIFALLGANGAGKTTTIRMLTGLTRPTSGTAHVNGLSIQDDMDAIRRQLGICPQDNLIFDKLTVVEHLRIFGAVKNVPFKQLAQEIDTRLEQVNLLQEKNKKAVDLSGGMKRRMCIAIALIGNPRVIILDEPTTGLDPMSRRSIWELLQKTKQNRTIILTTHSMEEADILGDGGIAILKKGKLEVVGNSLFLKNHYGIGYNMLITKGDNCDHVRVKELVEQHIPDSQLKTNTANQMEFLLPYQSVSRFPLFLKAVETSMEDLGIESYGLTQTTLEEVFLKINEDILAEEANNGTNNTH